MAPAHRDRDTWPARSCRLHSTTRGLRVRADGLWVINELCLLVKQGPLAFMEPPWLTLLV